MNTILIYDIRNLTEEKFNSYDGDYAKIVDVAQNELNQSLCKELISQLNLNEIHPNNNDLYLYLLNHNDISLYIYPSLSFKEKSDYLHQLKDKITFSSDIPITNYKMEYLVLNDIIRLLNMNEIISINKLIFLQPFLLIEKYNPNNKDNKENMINNDDNIKNYQILYEENIKFLQTKKVDINIIHYIPSDIISLHIVDIYNFEQIIEKNQNNITYLRNKLHINYQIVPLTNSMMWKLFNYININNNIKIRTCKINLLSTTIQIDLLDHINLYLPPIQVNICTCHNKRTITGKLSDRMLINTCSVTNKKLKLENVDKALLYGNNIIHIDNHIEFDNIYKSFDKAIINLKVIDIIDIRTILPGNLISMPFRLQPYSKLDLNYEIHEMNIHKWFTLLQQLLNEKLVLLIETNYPIKSYQEYDIYDQHIYSYAPNPYQHITIPSIKHYYVLFPDSIYPGYAILQQIISYENIQMQENIPITSNIKKNAYDEISKQLNILKSNNLDTTFNPLQHKTNLDQFIQSMYYM